MAPLAHSPLHAKHVALGAKLADFGGWEMPIEYPGGGVLKEHAAVREGVGVFDVARQPHLCELARASKAALFDEQLHLRPSLLVEERRQR